MPAGGEGEVSAEGTKSKARRPKLLCPISIRRYMSLLCVFFNLLDLPKKHTKTEDNTVYFRCLYDFFIPPKGELEDAFPARDAINHIEKFIAATAFFQF